MIASARPWSDRPAVCAQQTRRLVEERRVGFPNGDFRPNTGYAPKRHGKQSKKGKHV
jgi:hypothetical protein